MAGNVCFNCHSLQSANACRSTYLWGTPQHAAAGRHPVLSVFSSPMTATTVITSMKCLDLLLCDVGEFRLEISIEQAAPTSSAYLHALCLALLTTRLEKKTNNFSAGDSCKVPGLRSELPLSSPPRPKAPPPRLPEKRRLALGCLDVLECLLGPAPTSLKKDLLPRAREC